MAIERFAGIAASLIIGTMGIISSKDSTCLITDAALQSVKITLL
ncbi:hypothetical protein P9858_02085 [Niallia circulans]|nr:hypothetical protein [Niallia circulans]